MVSYLQVRFTPFWQWTLQHLALGNFLDEGDERFGQKKDDTWQEHNQRKRVYPSGNGFSIIDALVELSRLGQANAGEALARSTGGVRLSFVRLKALEEMLLKIGEDLHNQYLLSFTPTGDGPPGYRDIRVAVKNHPEISIRARPGYWAEP